MTESGTLPALGYSGVNGFQVAENVPYDPSQRPNTWCYPEEFAENDEVRTLLAKVGAEALRRVLDVYTTG